MKKIRLLTGCLSLIFFSTHSFGNEVIIKKVEDRISSEECLDVLFNGKIIYSDTENVYLDDVEIGIIHNDYFYQLTKGITSFLINDNQSKKDTFYCYSKNSLRTLKEENITISDDKRY